MLTFLSKSCTGLSAPLLKRPRPPIWGCLGPLTMQSRRPMWLQICEKRCFCYGFANISVKTVHRPKGLGAKFVEKKFIVCGNIFLQDFSHKNFALGRSLRLRPFLPPAVPLKRPLLNMRGLGLGRGLKKAAQRRKILYFHPSHQLLQPLGLQAASDLQKSNDLLAFAYISLQTVHRPLSLLASAYKASDRLTMQPRGGPCGLN